MPSTPPRDADLRTEEYALSDGRTLACTIGGDSRGHPVVAHHGTPGSRLFAALLSEQAAEEGVLLVVPDRPGYGRSSSPPPDWTWSDWRDDLEELLDAASIDRAGVLGFSGGGPFALAAANGDRATRLGLISPVVPPAENGLTALATVPFALRVFFRLSKAVASITGPDAIVNQYTDRSVSGPVSNAVADDFHEALRPGASAVARETRTFATGSLEPDRPDVPIRGWHGTRDENTPLAPARSLIEALDGTLATPDADHLGTLLDRRQDALEWLSAEE
ncbi:alpha/beta fold hydrolase [Halorarum halobium]|uniref:alpha/beta fold hydrolase n=1 Tax=Halorarum halobium TaxID=3075121 RepID=UPI0028AC71CD|nr:alpha/beta hydrolase [Halobaculum sp. XH14]